MYRSRLYYKIGNIALNTLKMSNLGTSFAHAYMRRRCVLYNRENGGHFEGGFRTFVGHDCGSGCSV